MIGMTDNRKHPNEVVAKEELEALVAEWRKQIRINSTREIQAENRIYRDCADDLEKLLDR
jgi:hypothetical protein